MKVALLILISFAAQAARLQPFFSVEVCSFEATDIVVVTPVSNKAELHVVETIKGDLRAGEPLILNELSWKSDASASPPPHMDPGERAIFFLLRPGAQFVSGLPAEPSHANGWRSAIAFEDMRFSTAWLRSGDVFAFVPLGDHAKVELQKLDVSEQEFRRQIQKGVQLRASFDQAMALPVDSLGRALQLAAIVRSGHNYAPWAALYGLAVSGPAAEVVLRELLADPKLAWWHSEIESVLKTNERRNATPLIF